MRSTEEMAFPAWLPISVFLHLIVIICSLLLLPSTMLEDWVIRATQMTRLKLKCQCHLCQQNLVVLMFLSLPLWFTRSFAGMFLKAVCLSERDNEDVDAVFFVFQWSGLLFCYFCYWCSKWNCKSCEHGEKLVAGVFIIANHSEDDLTL